YKKDGNKVEDVSNYLYALSLPRGILDDISITIRGKYFLSNENIIRYIINYGIHDKYVTMVTLTKTGELENKYEFNEFIAAIEVNSIKIINNIFDILVSYKPNRYYDI